MKEKHLQLWPDGGMVYTAVSKTAPERVVGSSPTLATTFIIVLFFARVA